MIYENTAALFQRKGWRRRIEALLLKDGRYTWESVLVSPHLHCAVPARRERVVYVGLLDRRRV